MRVESKQKRGQGGRNARIYFPTLSTVPDLWFLAEKTGDFLQSPKSGARKLTSLGAVYVGR
jgi:hypothetical protein